MARGQEWDQIFWEERGILVAAERRLKSNNEDASSYFLVCAKYLALRAP